MITTMSSSNKLSSFKKAQFWFLYRFALKKSAGWTAIYTILMFLCYPLIVFRENMDIAMMYPQDYVDRTNYLMNYQTVVSFVVSALMCGMVLVFSAVLYSYMHGKRSADFFHSMPVDRSIMLCANFSAGFTALVVPIWVNTIIASTSYLIFLPEIDVLAFWKMLALEVLAWTMGAFILLAISTLVAVTVSTAVENVGYTVALLLEGSVILLIWDLACSSAFDTYLSIFDGGTITAIFGNVLYYLSPVFALAKVILMLMDVDYASIDFIGFGGWLPLVFWMILGIGALWLAVRVYENRQSEKAEQWGRQSLIGFSVKLMSAIIGGFLFGNVVGSALGLPNQYLMLFGALTGAPIVYMIIEAITNRGFHNMKKCLPYLAAAVVITLTGSLYFAFDGFGFDERIPQPEEVKTVELELKALLTNDRKNDVYAKKYGPNEEEQIYLYNSEYDDIYRFEDAETIELVTEIHETALTDNSEYVSWSNISYETGLFDRNRRIDIRGQNIDAVLTLLHSDEFLEQYSPYFELKPEYLEFVQITDKMGNLIGDGELPKEAFEKLVSAIQTDLKNAETETLRDTKDNIEVANLTLVTKFPKEIYEEFGELYHYSMHLDYTVRPSDSNTCAVLEELGLELEVQDSFRERMLSAYLTEGYRNGNLPGMGSSSNVGVGIEKYDYYIGDDELTDKALLNRLLDDMTTVYNGYGDQYMVSLYTESEDALQVYIHEYYLNRETMAEIMVEENNFFAPYILTDEEWNLLNQGKDTVVVGLDSDVPTTRLIPIAEEHINWAEVKNMSGTTSMLDYCKQYAPQILDGKSQAELKCMEQTPVLNEEGYRIRIAF